MIISRLKINFNKFLIIIITLLLCIIILEIRLRFIGQIPSNISEGIFEQDGNSYRLKKDIKKTINWPSFSYIVYTNSYGFRDKTSGLRKIDDKSYFIFLGASEVFANGVNYEDSFVGILNEFAQKQNDIEVLNLAVGGHRFLDQEKLFKDFINGKSSKPKKLFFCLNALTIPLFDEKYTNILVKNGYLFDKNSWKIAYLRLMIGNISSAYCYFRDRFRMLKNQWEINDDSDKLPQHLQSFSKKNRMFDPEIVQKFENQLKTFENYCHENDIELIYIYLPLIDGYRLNDILVQINQDPTNYDSSYYEKLLDDICNKRKIEYINLAPILKKHFDKGEQLRFEFDSHYTKQANRIVGEYLIKKIFS